MLAVWSCCLCAPRLEWKLVHLLLLEVGQFVLNLSLGTVGMVPKLRAPQQPLCLLKLAQFVLDLSL